MKPDHVARDYSGRRVLVMGLGSFGGGVGAVRFLVARGAAVVVTDTRPATKLTETLTELSDLGERVTFKLGGHDAEDFRQADLIVVNPAVPRDHSLLDAARSAGVPLTSEMNLFWQLNPARVVAVTGSNGKSTTTALTHSILSHTGRRTWLGGNIGRSLLPLVDEIGPDDIVVLELSSFQLTDLDRLQVSPHVAIVTNFSPNHLDRHGTLEHYRWAKQTMFRWQQPSDAAIVNGDDADVMAWPSVGNRLTFGGPDQGLPGALEIASSNADTETIIRLSHEAEPVHLPLRRWLQLPGRHNMANALGATLASMWLGASPDAVREGLQKYEPLPHRLQFVGEFAGRRFYNDSLATTPESAEVALEAFDAPIILLAGGYDKKVDLSHMADAITRRAKAVALMGQTAATIGGHLARCQQEQGSARRCVVSPCMATFREAFEWAIAQSNAGDVVVLSPGCASYDWFQNFADRGRQFTELVHAWGARVAGSAHE